VAIARAELPRNLKVAYRPAEQLAGDEMSDDRFGCPCCSGAFDGFLKARALAAKNPFTAERPISRRTFLSGTAALTGLAASLPAAAKAQTAPATVFRGGTILTVDAAFSEAEAIAIRGNRIVAVGALEDVRAEAGASAREIDLAGRTLLPGFIDPHMHVVSGSRPSTAS
jgi:hypothetical protein